MSNPENLRLSLAAAMELGFVQGFFYRGARLHCINLLLTYDDGCRANCGFCGLSRERTGLYPEKKFIRVDWPTKPTDEIIERLQRVQQGDVVQRVCVSMITHPKAMADSAALVKRLHAETTIPISVLISPTIMTDKDLIAFKEAGADRIGVAIDCATPELFDELRGKGAKGPHKWDHYWKIYEQAMDIFGKGMCGVHLIRGVGETEEELARAIQRARGVGGSTHLFSFFPEGGSRMAAVLPPDLESYRRIQLARYLIDTDQARVDDFRFDDQGRLVEYDVPNEVIEAVLADGEAFRTSGCPGRTLPSACNRPFANERPGDRIRNYPFPLNEQDKADCRYQLFGEKTNGQLKVM